MSSQTFDPTRPSLTTVVRELLRAELAAGILGLRLFIACVMIATLMMGTVWMLGHGLTKSLSQGGTLFLGGDAAVSVVNAPLDPTTIDGLADVGTLSRVAETRTSATFNDGRVAVEVKGVDDVYPLYGRVILQSERPLADAFQSTDGVPGAVVEPGLLQRTGAEVGDTITLGSSTFRIADVLMLEPDRLSAGRFMVGPRVLISLDALNESGLIQLGSLVDYRYRVRANADNGDILVDQITALRPDAGWELETPRDAGDRVRRTVERTTTFLGLAGIVALSIGLAGAWAAAKAWLGRRARTIALYRLSGAEPDMVMGLHGAIIAIASAIGLAIGLALATTMTIPLMDLIAARLHLLWATSYLITPAVQVFGVLVLGLIGTGLLALSGAVRIAPGAAMRSGEADLQSTPRDAAIGIGLTLLALAVATATLPIVTIAAIAVAGLCAVVAILAASAGGIAAWAARQKPKGFLTTVMFQGLSKVGAASTRTVAIGIGIAGITAIVAAQTSLETALRAELPDRIPDVVLIDIQPDQVEGVRTRIAEDPALGGLQADPFMRMSILAVNGVPAEEALIREDKRWTIEGDRSFSWRAEAPGAELLAGEWWPEDYDGPTLVSPEEDLQEAFNLQPGDMLTYSVLGRSFTSEVANIRKEYHRTFRPEFLLMASPNPFRNAPQSWIMSLQGQDDASINGLIRDLGDAYPNVTSIDIRRLVTQVTAVVDGAVMASLLVALTLIVAGALSLAAVVAADVDGRRREALVFTLIGASRTEIAIARLSEAAAIGFIAAIVGGAAGLLGGYFAVSEALRVAWSPGLLAFAAPVLLGLLASVAAALVGGLGAVPRGRGQMARLLTS